MAFAAPTSAPVGMSGSSGNLPYLPTFAQRRVRLSRDYKVPGDPEYPGHG
jgi:hypothetical protein